MTTTLIKNNVYSIRTLDSQRRLFDQLIPLPDGTSYNAYLVVGSEKTALIDSAYPPKVNDFIKDIKEHYKGKIDYIISQHSEQDHSGAFPKLLELYPEAKIVTNPKCKSMINDCLSIPDDKYTLIHDGELLSLGDKTLEFLFTPWVHWPDTMMTYLKEDKILFTCDLFGSHLAVEDLFVKDEAVTHTAAKRYYAEIMMPFRNHIRKHLERLKNYDFEIISPSHGHSYQNPDFILNDYNNWVSENVKNEAVILYVSMYESTATMANYLDKALKDAGVSSKKFDLIDSDAGELVMDIIDAATLVYATPTVLSGPHLVVANAVYLINALRPKARYAAIMGSYGWGSNMVDQLKHLMTNLKTEYLDPVLVRGMPKEPDYKLLDDLAKNIAQKHESLTLAKA